MKRVKPTNEQLRRRTVAVFLVASTLTILLIGTLISAFIVRSIREEMVEAWGMATASQAHNTIEALLSHRDFKTPIRGDDHATLINSMSHMSTDLGVVEMRIWRPDGMILFSQDPEQIGRKPPTDEIFQQASAGRPTFELSTMSGDHHAGELTNDRELVAVYYPIRDHDRDKVKGVFEIYLSVDALNRHVQRALSVLIAGLSFLTVMLIAFAHVTSLFLLNRHNMLTQKTDELAKSEEQSRRIADILQGSLIKPVPDIPGLSTWVGYESAYEAETVGGDFYDIFEIGPGQAAILIGDVSGHGVEAAGLTETVRSAVRIAAQIDHAPSFVLTQVNEALMRQLTGSQFVTAIFMTIDTDEGVARIASAGHQPPLVLGEANCFLEIQPQFPLGILPGDYSETSVELQSGSGIVLYTDGLVEARRGKALFGEEGVFETVRAAKTTQPQLLVENLLAAATNFSRGRLHDDVAIVAIRFREDRPDET